MWADRHLAKQVQSHSAHLISMDYKCKISKIKRNYIFHVAPVFCEGYQQEFGDFLVLRLGYSQPV